METVDFSYFKIYGLKVFDVENAMVQSESKVGHIDSSEVVAILWFFVKYFHNIEYGFALVVRDVPFCGIKLCVVCSF